MILTIQFWRRYYLGHVTRTSWTNFCSPIPYKFHMKFDLLRRLTSVDDDGRWQRRTRMTDDRVLPILKAHKWTASSEFGTYRLCEQRRFRQACASVQSRQNLHCSLIQAVSQEEPSDRKPDPWPLWMAGHAQLKFVMLECSKTQICLTGLKWAFGSGELINENTWLVSGIVVLPNALICISSHYVTNFKTACCICTARVLNRIFKIGAKCCLPEKVGVLLHFSMLESETKSWSKILQTWS